VIALFSLLTTSSPPSTAVNPSKYVRDQVECPISGVSLYEIQLTKISNTNAREVHSQSRKSTKVHRQKKVYTQSHVIREVRKPTTKSSTVTQTACPMLLVCHLLSAITSTVFKTSEMAS
jgi:hypothetical protein